RSSPRRANATAMSACGVTVKVKSDCCSPAALNTLVSTPNSFSSKVGLTWTGPAQWRESCRTSSMACSEPGAVVGAPGVCAEADDSPASTQNATTAMVFFIACKWDRLPPSDLQLVSARGTFPTLV